MSRNELRVMARIVLIGVGLYVLLQTVLTILSGIASMPLIASAQVKEVPMIIIVLSIYGATALAAVYFLSRIADRFSAKIVAPEPADDTQISLLAAAFRLVCVTAGILFLYWTANSSIATLVFYISVKSSQYYPTFKDEIVKCVVMLGLGIYLACGAPGFVRWQVRKTLEQCKAIDTTP